MKRRAIIQRLAAIALGISSALFLLPTIHAGVESTGVGSTFGGGGGGGITISGTAIVGGTNSSVLFQCGGAVCEDADMTFLVDTLTATKIVGSTSITDTGLTAGRMTFAGTAGILTDDSDCTFLTDTLTCTKIGSTTFSGTNVAIGDTTFGSAAGAANAVDLGETAGRITFEGATADAFEGRLGWTDPTVGDQVILFPDLGAATTDTVVTLGLAQTISGAKTFSGTVTMAAGSTLFNTPSSGGGGARMLFVANSNTTGSNIGSYPELTPDALFIGLGTLSESVHFGDTLDATQAFDFQNGHCGTAACASPTLIVHSSTQNTGSHDVWYDDKLGQDSAGLVAGTPTGTTGIGGIKDLTESSATVFATVTVASGAWAGGTVEYTIEASDGTNHQVRASAVKFAAVNKAGTSTVQITTQDGTAGTTVNETTDGNAVTITSGTLTYAITIVDGTSGAIQFKANAVSSLTQTTLRVYYRVNLNGPGTITGG